ncbi:uncharacterized protein [Diabrotica undecimpunctata]|uniref:uncharacterized protein n=1 Tax=Diabrotica undecimpunctata TaxID=50387 RepID=UPI003B639E65
MSVHEIDGGDREQLRHELNRLQKKRATVKGQLSRFETFTNKYIKEQGAQLPERLDKCRELWREFNDIQSEIEIILDDSKNAENERSDFEEKYFRLIAWAEVKLRELNISGNVSTGETSQNITFPQSPRIDRNVKLPTIDIPSYQGSYTGWLEFHNTFNVLIHNNENLTNVQRFHYLKNSLKGEAAGVIRSLEVSDRNYEEAWSLLKSRYENKKLIAMSHIDSLYNFPNLGKEDGVQLRNFLDTIRKNLRALISLEEDVEKWDILLIYILEQKLDPITRKEWHKEGLHDKFSTMVDLQGFLERKCQMLEVMEASKQGFKGTDHRVKVGNSRSFVAVEDKCQFCEGRHKAYTCRKFINLQLGAKREEVKRTKSCWNCLQLGHGVPDCKLGGCKSCGRKHHSLLHDSTFRTNARTPATGNYTRAQAQPPRVENHLESRANNRNYSHHIQDGSRAQLDNHLTDTNVSNQSRYQGYPTHSSSNNNFRREINQGNKTQEEQGNIGAFPSVSLGENENQGYLVNDNNNHLFMGNNLRQNSETVVLLSTAIVYITGKDGIKHEGRVLLDSGSQSNFMSREFFEKLGLTPKHMDISVKGIGQSSTKITHAVDAMVNSRVNNYSFKASFLVINDIVSNLPAIDINLKSIQIPERLTLADEHFGISTRVDMILGSSVFWQLLCVGQVRIENTNLTVQKTKFGWVVAGAISSQQNMSYFSKIEAHTCNFSVNSSIHKQIEKFWLLEEFGEEHKSTKEEQECERIFKETTVKNEEGRFRVNLLLRDNINQLGNSSFLAEKRFKQLERRLEKNEELRESYHAFIREYIDLGHMSKLTSEETPSMQRGNSYYLPHHGVFKQNSITTKLRVVFDGSASTDTGISLNDTLMVGPKLQDNLFDILLRFRRHSVVMGADIAKMYRQVQVKQEHRNLQRILWRFNREEPIQTYVLNTVTYGTACASFLSIRCLHQTALDNLDIYPEASKTILKDFYVDDLLTGGDTIENVRNLKAKITDILKGGGFSLRKWVSNRKEILNDERDSSVDIEHYFSDKDVTNTLGVLWNSNEDTLRYSINIDKSQTRVTKRIILSTIARIFDPMGLLGPVVVRAKLIMQQLWKLNLTWDESVPLDIQTIWVRFRSQIDELRKISISRQAICTNNVGIELHCFTDASEVAYGAVLFIKSTDTNGNNYVNLLCAKSKVAPLKVVSLPRLELCGCLLGARLVKQVQAAMGMSINKVQFFCDSTISLSWIRGEPSQWQTFVSHRVAEIQQLSSVTSWRHISSKDNPADVISRGIDPDQLLKCKLWWEGPEWLKLESNLWPEAVVNNIQEIPERKKKSVLSCTSTVSVIMINKFSNFTRIQRVWAYCLRFINNCQSSNTKLSGTLQADEIHKATIHLIKFVQAEAFETELKTLKSLGIVKGNSKLISLRPFINEQGLIRLGGRLERANISYEQRHPIILPNNNHLTDLIVRGEHLKNMHAGPQLLLGIIRLKYWPIQGFRTVSKVTRRCITCFKVKPVTQNPIMGNLPVERITPSKPFTNTGVDYCGPFDIKVSRLRGESFVKAYICIFVCLSVKAVHLELAFDLTTEAFINCFKRFIARRGLCQNLFSDNGTNFVGARNHFNDLHSFLTNPGNQTKFTEFFSNFNIIWSFNPPRSPHFGGIWEAGVRSVKFHLRRVMGNERLGYDEFNTVITQIESCLNSRPLTPLTENPEDLEVLTPGHFLIGCSLKCLPQEDLRQHNPFRISRFHHVTQIIQHFWDKWSKEYLSHLQTRSKWRTSSSRQLQIGDMVIIKEDDLPPLKWQMGRVIDVHPGRDNVVRVATVRTSNGQFKLGVNKLCVLPIDVK